MELNRPDIELWAAFSEGDKDSFATLFRRHYSLLFQYGSKFCSDTAMVEDCIQELFTELWQKKPAPPVQSVKAYLLTSVKYKIFKAYRNNPSVKSYEAQNNISFEISHENFLIAKEDDRQKAKRIISAIEQLSVRQKEIIYLKIYQGMNYEEISEVMGINYQATRNLFSQSLKSLRKILFPE